MKVTAPEPEVEVACENSRTSSLLHTQGGNEEGRLFLQAKVAAAFRVPCIKAQLRYIKIQPKTI